MSDFYSATIFLSVFIMIIMDMLVSGCCFANKLRKIFIQSAKKKRRLKGF